ncbi:hypothetical protein KCU62_g4866, partial [Aureobasidium sp. EXF-3399]
MLPQAATLHPPRGPGTARPLALQAGAAAGSAVPLPVAFTAAPVGQVGPVPPLGAGPAPGGLLPVQGGVAGHLPAIQYGHLGPLSGNTPAQAGASALQPNISAPLPSAGPPSHQAATPGGLPPTQQAATPALFPGNLAAAQQGALGPGLGNALPTQAGASTQQAASLLPPAGARPPYMSPYGPLTASNGPLPYNTPYGPVYAPGGHLPGQLGAPALASTTGNLPFVPGYHPHAATPGGPPAPGDLAHTPDGTSHAQQATPAPRGLTPFIFRAGPIPAQFGAPVQTGHSFVQSSYPAAQTGVPAQYPSAPAPYPGASAPYPGAPALYPGASAPYPGAPALYPGASAPYPGAPLLGQTSPFPGPFPGVFPSLLSDTPQTGESAPRTHLPALSTGAVSPADDDQPDSLLPSRLVRAARPRAAPRRSQAAPPPAHSTSAVSPADDDQLNSLLPTRLVRATRSRVPNRRPLGPRPSGPRPGRAASPVQAGQHLLQAAHTIAQASRAPFAQLLDRGNRQESDPNWPDRYPAVAVRNVNPTQAMIDAFPQSEFLPLEEGERYIIISQESDGHVAARDFAGNEGWAPWDAFDVGEEASCDEDIFNNLEALERRPVVITIDEDAENGHILARAILGLPHALYQNRDDLTNYNSALTTDFDTAEKRIKIAQIFYDGIKAVPADPERDPGTTKTLYESLSTPDYTIDSFRQGRAVERLDAPNRVIIYVWIHSDFTQTDEQNFGGEPDEEVDFDSDVESEQGAFEEEDEGVDPEVDPGQEVDLGQEVGPGQEVDPGFEAGSSSETRPGRKADPGRKPEPYMGRTRRPGFRLYTHNHWKTSSRPTKSVNYRAARQAEQSTMYHVCELDLENYKFIWYCEQMVILLFETSCRELRELASGASSERKDQQADALLLTRIARDVFSATGWPGGCISNPNFGSSFGKNWSNPVDDALYEKLTWTRSYQEGSGLVFRRPPKILRINAALLTFGKWNLQCPSGQIPRGTEIYISFEFAKDANQNPRRHPHAWVGTIVPSLFGMTHVEKALSWALRVEWLEGDTPRAAYLQRKYNRKIQPFKPCAFIQYVAAMAVYSHFHQEISLVDPDDSDLDFMAKFGAPTADVVEERFDYLNRVMNFEPVNDLKILDADHSPRLLTEAEKLDKYNEAFSQVPNARFGGPPGDQQACDHCKWFGCGCFPQVAADQADNDTAKPCITCAERNMLCTFSNITSWDDFATLSHPLGDIDADVFISGAIPARDIQRRAGGVSTAPSMFVQKSVLPNDLKASRESRSLFSSAMDQNAKMVAVYAATGVDEKTPLGTTASGGVRLPPTIPMEFRYMEAEKQQESKERRQKKKEEEAEQKRSELSAVNAKPTDAPKASFESLPFPSFPLPSSPHLSRQYCQDESQVEKEESSQTEAQEKKDESQIQVNDSPRQLDHNGSLI